MPLIEHSLQPARRAPSSDVLTRVIVDRACGARGVVVWEQELAPGERIPRHCHDFEETLVVLAGRLRITLGGVAHEAPARSTALVPAGVAHSIRNESRAPALLLAHFLSEEARIIPLPEE